MISLTFLNHWYVWFAIWLVGAGVTCYYSIKWTNGEAWLAPVLSFFAWPIYLLLLFFFADP